MEKTIQSTIKRVATYALGFVGIIAMLALFVCIVILGPLALIPSTRTWAGLSGERIHVKCKTEKNSNHWSVCYHSDGSFPSVDIYI